MLHASRFFVWMLGALWGLLQPTIPFAAICLFAIMLDCLSAWRLSARVRKTNPKANDGKFKSEYARRMFATLLIVYCATLLGYLIDTYIYPFVDLYLANWISGGFAMVQLLSILENESSCNQARWAKVLQKVLVNKAARHFDVNPEDLTGNDEPAEGKEEENG